MQIVLAISAILKNAILTNAISFLLVVRKSIFKLILLTFVTAQAQAQTQSADNDEISWDYFCDESSICYAIRNAAGVRIMFVKNETTNTVQASLVFSATSRENSPISILLDTGIVMQLTTTACNQQFCEAVITSEKTKIVIDQLKRSNQADIAYLDYALDRPEIIISSVSMEGFQDVIPKIQPDTKADLPETSANSPETSQPIKKDSEQDNEIVRQIYETLVQWRQVWEDGDIDGYLAMYSINFEPDRFDTYDAWLENRIKNISQEHKVNITLSNALFNIYDQEQEQKARVTFDQLYESGADKNNTSKQITFVKQNQQWKIVKETILE